MNPDFYFVGICLRCGEEIWINKDNEIDSCCCKDCGGIVKRIKENKI